MLRTILAPARTTIAALALVLAGCGSSGDVPPAAGPDRSPPPAREPAGEIVASAPPDVEAALRAPATETPVGAGTRRAVLLPRERVLEIREGDRVVDSAPAGAGPTHVVRGERGLAYVVDTAGDGLLVFETTGELRILRRYPLAGAPYGAASDLRNGRLWVTLTARNELVELATSARPHRLDSFPTVRQPDAVAVDARGRVFVAGEELQVLDPRRSR